MIPYGKQSISEADIAAVRRVLESDWLTQGPAVPRFEADVARFCEGEFAVATNSATSALHLACRALDLVPGDLLWTSPISFVASASCGLYCGAGVDFVDIDRETWNISPADLERKLAEAGRAGRMPRILVVVHFAGQPAEMERIGQVCRRHGIRIVEDASHALGASYQGRPVGCGAWSDVTVFSFHPVKIVTSGEGGVAVTNDPELARRMRSMRSHCIDRDAAHRPPEEGEWFYRVEDLGFNYRLTDLQAALGSSQMTRLEEFVRCRSQLAARYDELLGSFPVEKPVIGRDRTSSWHLYVIRLGGGNPFERRRVFDAMRADGIGVNVHYVPIHQQPLYRRMLGAGVSFPEAEAYYREALTLPLFPAMTEAEQDSVVDSLRRAIE